MRILLLIVIFSYSMKVMAQSRVLIMTHQITALQFEVKQFLESEGLADMPRVILHSYHYDPTLPAVISENTLMWSSGSGAIGKLETGSDEIYLTGGKVEHCLNYTFFGILRNFYSSTLKTQKIILEPSLVYTSGHGGYDNGDWRYHPVLLQKISERAKNNNESLIESITYWLKHLTYDEFKPNKLTHLSIEQDDVNLLYTFQVETSRYINHENPNQKFIIVVRIPRFENDRRWMIGI